ncbi:MAG TPA: hypothetical protein VEC19_16990 [Usitatibacter sp.]|nr:hypothetical protein [Usitatibacter sp.]
MFALVAAPAGTLEAAPTDSVAFPNGAIPIDEIASLARLEKDQFEATSAFNKRRCDAMAKLLGTDLGKPIVFRELKDTRSWYDADRQRFVFENLSKAGTPASGFYLVLSSRESQKPGFVGKTAYGVTREIKVKEGHYVALAVPHSSHLVQHLSAILPMKPDRARALAGDLRLEVVTRIGPPCISTDLHRQDPTLDSPTKETKWVYAIQALPGATSWQIVRGSTGEVLTSGKR